MIHNLKPYPAYKDSGVPWLGKVPEHWGLKRTKTVLRERSQKGFPEEPLLAATQTVRDSSQGKYMKIVLYWL